MNQEKETETVTLMVRRYCCGVHWTKGEALCPACNALLEYARERRDRYLHGKIQWHFESFPRAAMRQKIKKR